MVKHVCAAMRLLASQSMASVNQLYTAREAKLMVYLRIFRLFRVTAETASKIASGVV